MTRHKTKRDRCLLCQVRRIGSHAWPDSPAGNAVCIRVRRMRALQTVLIVEDDNELRRHYRTALAMAGFEAREARSGFEALRLLEVVRPDVIVLDLFLPGLDGLTVRDEVGEDIPIVIVTGSTESVAGVDAEWILRKPVPADELVLTVRKRLLTSGPSLTAAAEARELAPDDTAS